MLPKSAEPPAALDLGFPDIEVRHHAQPFGPEGADEHAPLGERGGHGRRVAVEVDHRDVRLRRLDAHPGRAGNQLCEAPRVRVVAREARTVVVERVRAGGREAPDLAHAAAQHLAKATRPQDRLGAARKHGADRRAEALREANADRVEGCRQRHFGRPARDGGIPNAGPVEV
jgi:hypothetical protein